MTPRVTRKRAATRPLLRGGDAAIDELIEKPMDDGELYASLPRGVKVLRYADLKKYSSVDQMLPRARDAAVVLYEQQPKNGHWCALAKNENGLFFFDPYGEMPDKQLEYSKFSRSRVLGSGDKSISALIATSRQPNRVFYNPYDYQMESPNVNTCGRHCVNFIRCIMDGGTLDSYYDEMAREKRKTGQNADQIVTKEVPIDLPDT